MKKYRVLLSLAIVVCLSLLDSNVSLAFSGEVVSSITILHEHTEETGSCYEPVYHTHTGVSYQVGGCYGGSYYSGCGKTLTYLRPDYNASSDGSWGLYQCPSGHYQTRSVNGASGLICQLGAGYSLICGSTTSNVESYNLICTDESKELGRATMHKIAGGNYTLSVSCDIANSYLWSDGTTEQSISVTSNGYYECQISYTDGEVSRTIVLSYTVEDYDSEPPKIMSVIRSTERVAGGVDITLDATDNVSTDLEYILVK